MQVFIINNPFFTACHLDPKRLNKQIIECRQILCALSGETKGWANHPVTKMYRHHEAWLALYMQCLQAYKDGYHFRARQYSDMADNLRPSFHCELLYSQMRARLYTKSPHYYMTRFGKTHRKTEINMYWNNETRSWMYYRNGKRLNLTRHPEELIDILIDCLNGDITDFADADKIIKQLKTTGDPYLIEKVDELSLLV